MPSANTITLVDDQAASLSFNPHRISAQSQVFTHTGQASIDEAADVLELSMSPATKQRDTRHVNLKLVTPIEQTIDGIVSVAASPLFSGRFVITPGMTTAQKERLSALAAEFVLNALTKGYVEDNDIAW